MKTVSFNSSVSTSISYYHDNEAVHSMVHSFTVPVAKAAFLQMSNKVNVRRQALMLFQQPQQQPFSDHKSTTNVLPSLSFHNYIDAPYSNP
jgi:hypothetical protein